MPESGWKFYLHYYGYWKSNYETFIKYLFGTLRESIKLEVTIALNYCLFNILIGFTLLRMFFWDREELGF